MKYTRQFGIILFVTCLGEGLKYSIPLPIPAAIYGLALMFFALTMKWIKIEEVEGAGHYLIEIMPLMFIPASVGLINYIDEIRPILVPIVVITAVSTVLVFLASGLTTEYLLGRKKK